jgi:hypothetical protein
MATQTTLTQPDQKSKTLLDIALTRFHDFDGWLRENEQIWTKKNCTVWMKNADGFCVIVMFTDAEKLTDRRYSQELTIGVYDPKQGWIPSTRAYTAWKADTRRRLFQ